MNPSSRSFLVFALITRAHPEQFSQSALEFHETTEQHAAMQFTMGWLKLVLSSSAGWLLV